MSKILTKEQIEEIQARCEAATLKEIPGYGGYCADNLGNIWSTESNWRGYGKRILITEVDKDGYLKVRVHRRCKRVKQTVHKLVALAWLGLKPENHEVCHLDGSRDNNRPDNLRWGTKSENALDRNKHGRFKNPMHNPEVILKRKRK